MKSEFFLVALLVSGINSSPTPQAPSAEAANPFFTPIQNFWNGIGNTFRPQSSSPQIQPPQLPQWQFPQWQLPQFQWPQLPQLPQIFQFPIRQPNNNNQGNGLVLPYFLPNSFNRPSQLAQNQFGQDPTIIIITRPASTEGQSLPPSSQSIPASSESPIDTTNNTSTSESSPIANATPVLIQNSSKPINSTEFSSGIDSTIVNETMAPNSTDPRANTIATDPIAVANV